MSKTKKRHVPIIGAGHGSNTPNLPHIREVTDITDERQQALLALMESGTRIFRMGKALIFLSPPTETASRPGWHLSISREDHYPSWDEVAKVWYELVPDADQRTGLMVLPPRVDYINIHNYCFQLHEELPDDDVAR